MSITIRKGTREDLDVFINLLQEVWQGMENREWFYLDSPEEFRRQMESGMMAFWLAMDGDRAAGVFDLLIPGPERCNYGYALGLTHDQLMQVVNMDTAAVHPDYRGQGIQRRLLETAEAWLGEEQDRILLCTIHPDNRFSLQNALNQGYEIRKKLNIYGSVRYLLQKNIQKNQK